MAQPSVSRAAAEETPSHSGRHRRKRTEQRPPRSFFGAFEDGVSRCRVLNPAFSRRNRAIRTLTRVFNGVRFRLVSSASFLQQRPTRFMASTRGTSPTSVVFGESVGPPIDPAFDERFHVPTRIELRRKG